MTTATESRVKIPLNIANASDLPKEGWTKVEVIRHDDIEPSSKKGTLGMRVSFRVHERAVFDPQSGALTETVPAHGFLDNTFWLTLGGVPPFKAFYKACTGKSALTGSKDEEDEEYSLFEDDYLRQADECIGSMIWVKIVHEFSDNYPPKAKVDYNRYRKAVPNSVYVQTED